MKSSVPFDDLSSAAGDAQARVWSREDARRLCKAARQAWRRREPEATQVRFEWKGETYHVIRSGDHREILTLDGRRLASIFE